MSLFQCVKISCQLKFHSHQLVAKQVYENSIPDESPVICSTFHFFSEILSLDPALTTVKSLVCALLCLPVCQGVASTPKGYSLLYKITPPPPPWPLYTSKVLDKGGDAHLVKSRWNPGVMAPL